MSQQDRLFRKGLLDFHIGEDVDEIAFDVTRYIEEIAAAGVRSVTFMTKDAAGNSYYDTSIGHKNRHVGGDLLAEATKAAEQAGVEIIAYYNVGLNTHVAKANPDYRQRSGDGLAIEQAFAYYDLLCMNSPYRDLVFAQLTEIAAGYPVAGFFFDITYVWDSACHCEYCQLDYRERYGTAIPVSPGAGTADMRQWHDFRRRIRSEFLRDAVARLKAIRPELSIGWNHAGDLLFAHVEPDQLADYLVSEFHPPHYLSGSLLARWKRPNRKPFELMVPTEMGSWGEWTLAPEATLLTCAAICVAGGGAISLGHVAVPSGVQKGQLARPVLDAIAKVNEFVSAREEWLVGAESVPDTAVVYGVDNKRMFAASGLPTSVDDALNGTGRALVEGHRHFDVISERQILADISRYRVLILPDQAYLSDAVVEALEEYVRSGGALLATHRTSLYHRDGTRRENFALADVFGVDFVGTSRYSVTYVNSNIAGVPQMPILVKDVESRTLLVTPSSDVDILGTVMHPALEAKPHRHVYHQHAHPAVDTGHPAITVHRYGKGRCAYVAAPLDASFWLTGSPWLRRILDGTLESIDPDPFLRVDGPLDVEVTLTRQHGRTIVHFVHIGGQLAGGSPVFTEEALPSAPITVHLRATPARVTLAPEGIAVPFSVSDGIATFTIPGIRIHAMAVIEPSTHHQPEA